MSSCPNVISKYIIPIISGFGVLLNFFNIVIFSIILTKGKQANSVFKYLLAKSISDTLQFVFQILSPIYYSDNVYLSKSYFSQVWYIWFYYYGEYITELCSDFLDLLATFDCYVNLKTINKKLQFLQTNKFFFCLLAFILVYSCGFYTFSIFEFKIVDFYQNITNNKTEWIGFDIDYTDFHRSADVKIIKMVHTIVRDVVISVALMILNVLIFNFIKSSLNFKMNKSGSKNRKTLERSRNRNRIMVIAIGLSHVIGHLPLIVYHLPFNKVGPVWNCFTYVSIVLFLLSYTSGFFIYFIFNRSFSSNAKNILCFFRHL